MFDRLASSIDGFTKWVGERIIWISTVLVLLIFTDVLMRYLLSTSKAWITDLEWHLFAMLFLIGSAYTLKVDQHVRVDVFYAKFTKRRQDLVNKLGVLIFLIPWCLIVIYTSFHYTEHSFAVHERSAEPGGLPARFIIKGMITVGFVLLLLQGIASLLRVRDAEPPKPTETI
jgi:TRAP-type mannitol/chloroaromatic compound transport system permease small subunit